MSSEVPPGQPFSYDMAGYNELQSSALEYVKNHFLILFINLLLLVIMIELLPYAYNIYSNIL